MESLVKDIGKALKHVDDSRESFKSFHPGVGPYGEPQLVKKIATFLNETNPILYINAQTKRIPDLWIPDKWAIEIKIVRPFGDNGKEAEHWSQNLLHPYAGNVSSIGDVYKLLDYEANGEERKGIIVITYSHSSPVIDLAVLVESFEVVAKDILSLPISKRYEDSIDNLIHPVHQKAKIFGWELI
ncbi:MAG: hypothetical protein DWQ07_24945 [Chloroflexi bacterium]|nr:MAG: hypothetical protein DWQ07_24945 [Chloroflexota bacterium]